MKTTILAGVVASLIGGVAGGLVVNQLGGPGESAPIPESARTSEAAPGFDDTALKVDIERNRDDLADLRAQLTRLEGDLADARDERNELLEENAGLKARVNELETGPPAPDEPTIESPDPMTEIDRAVKEALEKEKQKERAERAEVARKQMAGWMDEGNTRVIDTLDTKLTLTQHQRERVRKILDGVTESVAALKSGEGDEAAPTWDEIWEQATTDVRAELGSAQLNTFDELVGEGSLATIAWPEK